MDYEYTEHKIACKPSPAEATVNNKKDTLHVSV